jgi:hypothetical protein
MKSASGDLASDDDITSGALFFRTSFLQMLQASFLSIQLLSFVLPEPMLQKDTKFFVYGPAHLDKY